MDGGKEEEVNKINVGTQQSSLFDFHANAFRRIPNRTDTLTGLGQRCWF